MNTVTRVLISGFFIALFPLAASAQQAPGPGSLPPGSSSVTISGATDITAEATSAAGATVTFAVTAQDTDSSSLTPVCTPASGSLFALGSTTVNCTATSVVNSATSTSASFVVGVVDTTAPSISAPADQTISTSTLPATLSLTPATATDLVDPSPVITSDAPASFPVGTTTITWTATDSSGNASTSTSKVIVVDTSTSSAESVSLAIRDGSTLIGPVALALPSASAGAVALNPSDGSAAHTVSARSVLALLSSLDAATSTFDITDLQYFSSFGSFLVNCISIPAASASPECFNWTYAVNGAFPANGMDQTTLNNGDSAYVFFGSAWQISADKSTASTGEQVTITAQTYDAASGTYVPAANQVVGAVQFDSNFVATEFATSTTDSNGKAIVTLSATGTYALGAQATGYYPNVSLTISAASAPAAGSGGGGGGGGTTHLSFSVPNALAYLSSKQSSDGSFGDDRLSDWAALAYAASDPGSAKQKLTAYMTTAHPALSVTADYERHAMALEALGINPYSGAGADYITPIVSAFDGTKLSSFINVDIFAIFPLLHAGYSTSDDIIQKLVAYIVSEQGPNGSWGDADTTAAGIQALSSVSSLPGVNSALANAKTYLKTQQQTNGSFGTQNPEFTSAWALQAIASLGEVQTSWAPAGYYATDYLAGLQQTDGGVDSTSTPESTRVWATEFAVPGVLGKSWSALLSSFARPSSGGGTSSNATSIATSSATSTTATSTPPIATTTPQVASSTPLIASTTPATLQVLSSTTVTASPSPRPIARTAIARTKHEAPELSASSSTTSSQVAAAATALDHIDVGSWWFLLVLVLLTIFVMILLWSISNAYRNRDR